MNGDDPLAQLRDLHLPEPVSWWPPAPGWWIAAMIVLAASCCCILFIRNHWLRNRYRRAALHKLDKLADGPPRKAQEYLEELSALLRRVAIQAYGRNEVAPLSGVRWLTFLDRTGRTDQFTRGAAKVLGSGLYETSVDADPEQVKRIIRQWIREHRR